AARLRDSLISEPDTNAPRATRTRASALIPAPPTPTRCTERSRSIVGGLSATTGHLEDPIGQPFGRVRAAEPACGIAHRPERAVAGEEPVERVPQRFRRGVVIGDPQPTAGPRV